MRSRRSIRQHKNIEQLKQIINFEKIVQFKGGQTTDLNFMEIIYKQPEIIKIRLTGNEFLDIWKGVYIGNPNYKQFYEETRIEISNPNNEISNGAKVHIAVFRNVEVSGFLNLIEDIEYLPINLSGVTFNERMQIQKGTFLNFYIGRNPGENVFKNGLCILGGVFKNAISLSSIGSMSQHNTVEIHGGIFESKLRIWSTRNATVNISKGDFQGGLSLSGEFQNIYIGGGTFHSDIEIESLLCHGNFQIVGGYFSKHLTSESQWIKDEFPKFISFKDSGIIKLGLLIILGSFVISNINAKYINISYSLNYDKYFSFINNFHIIKFNKDVIIQSNDETPLFINKLQIEDSTISSGCIFRLDKVRICDLWFENIISQGNLYLNKIVGGELYSFINSETENIYKKCLLNDENLKSQPQKGQFRIIETDWGSSVIFNCNFSAFKVVFHSSKIDNIFLSGSNFPLNIQAKEEANLLQLKNAYNQLKKIFEKSDIHTSNHYALREIEIYREYLWTKRENRKDFIILFLNNITSNHNTNWLRSLFCLLLFNTISYGLLLYFLGIRFDFSNEGIRTLFNLIGYFFTYLNPIHRTDFLNTSIIANINWNAFCELIDSVSKIVNAYLIYQFVQSFRKFGRK